MRHSHEAKSDLYVEGACLTAHVLDLAKGRPGSDIELVLERLEPEGPVQVARMRTGKDGRPPAPLLSQGNARAGRYLLTFLSKTEFIESVPVEFTILDPARHYHVPLILSPFGITTYRGAPPHRAPEIVQPMAANRLSVPVANPPAPGAAAPGVTVHLIDTQHGIGAGGVKISLRMPDGREANSITTAEGRTCEWLVAPGDLQTGSYEITYHLDDYFQSFGYRDGARAFFPTARLKFHVNAVDEHLHLPLLATPWGYSCYRGS